MIILMPQGLIINKDNQNIRTVEYATIGKMQSRIKSGDLVIKMDNLQTGKVEELELDGRFAHVRTLDKTIIEAYNAYHANRTQ